ncbi:MAG TPA: right-handed parallel beta-helix repeat-containing protein [Chitinophagaceae bacterium]|nr:right-handed parallel beta-helix repeat-containing protein [Chitinophagaceae bacterium]
MIKRILLSGIVVSLSLFSFSQKIVLQKGMEINRSVTVQKKLYPIAPSSDTSIPVIHITGNDMVIDFGNAVLEGSKDIKHPDRFFGVAILVTNSKNVTIRNLNVKGYKVALLARNVDNLTIENCDLSYNYRPHLNSTQEKEDISDWMSYHQNEKDEWLRYGAAMYLRNCNGAIINNCKVTGGQNALMMMDCNDGKIFNNDFSFNSGIGIGMYRCNRNEVSFNRIIFNVRGYSHGVYNRGQDSAGILVYEQSNNNVFYRNNVTHGGDGFFLWAGQTTMDTGEGGCNDNLLLQNDFSYAPTNGIEVTFSRNRIIRNRIFECDHGIWGGYSFSSVISDNQFRNNHIGIAIEHGQYNQVSYNLFAGDKEAIRLWSRKQQPTDWGYAKYRDTRSTGYIIASNSFNKNPVVFNVMGTDSVNIFNNTYYGSDLIFKTDSSASIDTSISFELPDVSEQTPDVKNPKDPFKESGKLAGRKNILVTEWGPYDFQSPIIWNTNPVDAGDTMKFKMLGPSGKWIIRNSKGVEHFSAMSGKFPDSITVQKVKGERTDILIEAEYRGGTITTAFGEKVKKGKPYLFRYRKFFQPVNWEVNFYSLDTSSHNPIITNSLFSPLERKAPFLTEKKKQLEYAWWGGIKANDQQHVQFITIANGDFDIPEGKYEIAVTWDDAVRVYLDNKMIVDEWNPSLYKFDESPHKKVPVKLGGRHQLRVEHLELGGFATLSLKINPIEE